MLRLQIPYVKTAAKACRLAQKEIEFLCMIISHESERDYINIEFYCRKITRMK